MEMNDAAIPAGITTADARSLQQRLAERVVLRGDTSGTAWVAGIDVHYPEKQRAHAVATLFSYPDLVFTAVAEADLHVTFPYVPGLLSFREAPAAVAAIERLPHRPDLLLCDGQGYAHPAASAWPATWASGSTFPPSAPPSRASSARAMDRQLPPARRPRCLTAARLSAQWCGRRPE